MTNYLNRMAGRAMGAITTAQPFVPSVFTPAFGLARNNASALSLLDPTTEDGQRADHVRQSDASEGTRDAKLPGQALNPTTMSRDAVVSPQAESLRAPEFAAERLDPPSPSPKTMLSIEPGIAALRTRLHLQPDTISPYTPDQSIATSPGSDQVRRPENDSLIADVAKPRVAPTFWVGAKISANASPTYSREARGPAPEPPIIRVSIGRIDVRAEFSAATPSPAPARNIRPASLSLDEYLKQRSEGRR